MQFIVSFMPMLAVITAAFVLAYKVKRSGRCMEQMLFGFSFGWFIEKSPAQVAFFMFSIITAITTTLIACTFSQVSKHLILTLDIIFFLSSMLLILFHQFKEYTFTSL